MELTANRQGKIEGSCEMDGRKGTILVHAFSHEMHIPRDTHTGLPSGKRVHHPLTITKEWDKASPKLKKAWADGERFSDVTIKWYRIDPSGKEEHYYTHKLEDAIIVDIKPYMPNTMDKHLEHYGHMEEISFTYRKITWRWEPDGIESSDSWLAPEQ